MATNEQLEKRVEALERRQCRLTDLVQELGDLAPTDVDGTPMAQIDATTWKDSEMAEHIYETVEQLIEESVNQYLSRERSVSGRTVHMATRRPRSALA